MRSPRLLTSLDFLKKETVRSRALRKRWDVIIVDEAHGLAESGTPQNPYRTQRTRLGLALRENARGLLLLTATPHNGYPHSFRSLLELVEPTGGILPGRKENVLRRLPEAAEAARQRLYGHECMRACYLCLKHYSNQRWHPFFDKDRVRDLLLTLSSLTPVETIPAPAGAGVRRLRDELDLRRRELEGAPKRPGCPGPQSPIESLLLEALLTQTELLRPTIQYEVKDGERLVTVPDFAYPEFRIAVFCDGFAYHGNPDTLELDARKRNWLQEQGWIVLTFWGKTIMRDAGACAREILSVYQQRKKQADSPG